MHNDKVVFVMPSPSPIGGMRVISKMYYDNKIFDNPQYLHFNSEFQGKSRLKRLFQSFSLRYSFIKLLKKEKPKGVYIYTSSYMGFYDKSMYCFLCKTLGVKSSLNIVGGEFFKFYEKSAANKKLVSACVKLPHSIVIGCENWRENFLAKFSPQNLKLIHNPVIPYANPKTEHIFKNNKVNFLFFGRLAEPKGVKETVAVLKKLPQEVKQQMLFTFAGKGPMAHYIREELKEEIAKAEVELFEEVSDEEKEQLMYKANVFVLPSHAEVLPISLLEAMSQRMPAIVTAVGGMPDAIVEGENGFLIKDVPSIAAQLPKYIQYFIDNPQQIESMGEASLNKIHKQFSFDVIFNKSIATFN